MTQIALGIFLCMVAFSGGLFCILAVVGLFWVLRLNVINRAPSVPESAVPKVDAAPEPAPILTLPKP